MSKQPDIIVSSIEHYIEEKCEFYMISFGWIFIILHGLSKHQTSMSPSRDLNSDDLALASVRIETYELLKKFGHAYPMITIEDGVCHVKFHQEQTQSYADPTFFDWLDQIINCINEDNDLSRFLERLKNVRQKD